MAITIAGSPPGEKMQNGKIVFVSKYRKLTLVNPPDEALYPGNDTYPGGDVYPGGNE